jgi:hypothetical protein
LGGDAPIEKENAINQPHHQNTKTLSRLDFEKISERQKNQCRLLGIAQI